MTMKLTLFTLLFSILFFSSSISARDLPPVKKQDPVPYKKTAITKTGELSFNFWQELKEHAQGVNTYSKALVYRLVALKNAKTNNGSYFYTKQTRKKISRTITTMVDITRRSEEIVTALSENKGLLFTELGTAYVLAGYLDFSLLYLRKMQIEEQNYLKKVN